MGFFKNINATPRIGSVIRNSDGFSIYTENGWRKWGELCLTEEDILYEARIVERADGSRVDIDDIFGEHISDERVLYELILRSMCPLPFSQISYSREDGLIYTRIVTLSAEGLILDQRSAHIRGWFSSHDAIREIFEKYPSNIEFYVSQAIKYLQKLKSAGVPYKYIDKEYMSDLYSGDEIFKKKYNTGGLAI